MILVPRWGGRADSGWYPWFCARTGATFVPLPDPDLPVIADCIAAVRPHLTEGAAVVAHSVGAQAVLRALAADPGGPKIGALMAVAGWFKVDDVRPTSAPWCGPIQDLAAAVARCGRLVNLVSDNEPMVSDWQANADAWRRAGADVVVVPGAGHFMGAREAAVVDAWRRIEPR